MILLQEQNKIGNKQAPVHAFTELGLSPKCMVLNQLCALESSGRVFKHIHAWAPHPKDSDSLGLGDVLACLFGRYLPKRF